MSDSDAIHNVHYRLLLLDRVKVRYRDQGRVAFISPWQMVSKIELSLKGFRIPWIQVPAGTLVLSLVLLRTLSEVGRHPTLP